MTKVVGVMGAFWYCMETSELSQSKESIVDAFSIEKSLLVLFSYIEYNW